MKFKIEEEISRIQSCRVPLPARFPFQPSCPVVVPDLWQSTGQEHRVRIDIPGGIEFEIAEIASASTKATGAITLDLTDTYGQLNIIRLSRTGVIRSR